MRKISERTNVLTETENKSFIHAIVNAVTKGYADNTILEDIMDLVRRKEISKGVLLSSPDAIRNYGDSFSESLHFLADSIEQLEVIDEPSVKMKEKPIVEEEDEPAKKDDESNIVEKEMEKIEDKEEKDEEHEKNETEEDEQAEHAKKSSIEKFSRLKISEDWDKYKYDQVTNTMKGTIILNFNENMGVYKTANKINMIDDDVNCIINKIYAYCKNEYKKLKTDLDISMFKSNIRFSDLGLGQGEIDYEIKGAF
jgi:hypothetical protein